MTTSEFIAVPARNSVQANTGERRVNERANKQTNKRTNSELLPSSVPQSKELSLWIVLPAFCHNLPLSRQTQQQTNSSTKEQKAKSSCPELFLWTFFFFWEAPENRFAYKNTSVWAIEPFDKILYLLTLFLCSSAKTSESRLWINARSQSLDTPSRRHVASHAASGLNALPLKCFVIPCLFLWQHYEIFKS